ncbi:MAG TPA: hypothetical protein VG733_17665 [Chthoniobacteraceae bacterium]|nr:hypothetical protein [Chthoniobacteraceae bacterium]
MTRFPGLILLVILAMLAPPLLRAQDAPDPSDLFLKAYMANKEALDLEQNGKHDLALQKLRDSQGILVQIQKTSPDWQPVIVAYRLKKISEAIAAIEKGIPFKEGGPSAVETHQDSGTPTPQPVVTGS